MTVRNEEADLLSTSDFGLKTHVISATCETIYKGRGLGMRFPSYLSKAQVTSNPCENAVIIWFLSHAGPSSQNKN